MYALSFANTISFNLQNFQKSWKLPRGSGENFVYGSDLRIRQGEKEVYMRRIDLFLRWYCRCCDFRNIVFWEIHGYFSQRSWPFYIFWDQPSIHFYSPIEIQRQVKQSRSCCNSWFIFRFTAVEALVYRQPHGSLFFGAGVYLRAETTSPRKESKTENLESIGLLVVTHDELRTYDGKE